MEIQREMQWEVLHLVQTHEEAIFWFHWVFLDRMMHRAFFSLSFVFPSQVILNPAIYLHFLAIISLKYLKTLEIKAYVVPKSSPSSS
jgi:hypothetical protein